MVETVLEYDVGLQLLGVGLVHFPPEELVALASGDEAGLGEAVGVVGCGYERLTSMSFEYRPLNTPPYSGFGRLAIRLCLVPEAFNSSSSAVEDE